MFKSLLKGIVVSVVAFSGSASAAPAMYALLDNSPLLNTVQNTGTSVWYNPEDCKESAGLMGFYETVRNLRTGVYSVDRMGICVENHRGNVTELGNTVRHESVHVAQECHGGPFQQPYKYMPVVSNKTLAELQHYPAEHYAVEIEAFTLAELLTNDQVRKLVIAACSN
jgi:hypothetical protein